jgi:hypothetical protein
MILNWLFDSIHVQIFKNYYLIFLINYPTHIFKIDIENLFGPKIFQNKNLLDDSF